MMRVVVVLALLAVAYAGRAPYLGGDIQDLIESTKATVPAGPSPASFVNKPVTEKQRRDSTNYNAKFADIAKAYAEGYKAAIKAVQARAFIAKRRLLGIRPKSTIPGLVYRNPYLEKVAKSLIPGNNPLKSNLAAKDARVPKSTIPVPDNTHTQISSTSKGITSSNDEKGGVVTKSNIPTPAPEVASVVDVKKPDDVQAAAVSDNIVSAFTSPRATVNAVEKQWMSDTPHQINERSAHSEVQREDHPAFRNKPVALWTEEERSRIAKLNARARHRNIYFDGAGGDPFRGGGVLSVQNAISKKHRRRRRSSEDEVRYRRSTYDDEYYPRAHYVHRHRRSHMPYLGQNLDAMGVVRAVPKSWTNPLQKKRDEEKKLFAPAQTAAYLNSPPMDVGPVRFTQFMPPAFRGTIPQPMPMPAMMSSPMPMNYAAMFSNPQQPTFQAFRSMIPGYPAFMQAPLGYGIPGPFQAGVTDEKSPSVETKPADNDVREKKSTIPVPDTHH